MGGWADGGKGSKVPAKVVSGCRSRAFKVGKVAVAWRKQLDGGRDALQVGFVVVIFGGKRTKKGESVRLVSAPCLSSTSAAQVAESFLGCAIGKAWARS